ncbi:PAS domain-containing protein [Flaviaesturariibacter aridisoli]|uniref:histidine kinase n=1 Tax=Flaviaesturariibacter aridisoli TaxID=2545761 RepID=A0A4R4E5F7_9BACT|nr:PAS domain-containing protein [Flaviaesturariibacter aridisoli]TCZ74866.1 PAS domain S-box protein [Flaviaesturariibacter aridisoli]
MPKDTIASQQLSTLFGSGEVGRLLGSFPWSESPLGPPGRWPAAFRVTLGNLLHSAFPMLVLWGPDLRVFYNDAYRPALGEGAVHERLLGRPGAEVYGEAWSTVAAMLERVLHGETVYYEDLPAPTRRNDRVEEVYWTSSLSPVFGDAGSIDGVLVVCKETTEAIARSRNLISQVNAALAIFMGPDLVIAEANPATLRIWGLGPEVIGRPLAEVRTATSERFIDLLRSVYSSGAPVQGFETPASFHRPDGTEEQFYCNFEFAPYYDNNGTLAGVMSLAYDVTAQVLAKRAQAIAEEEVQSAITAADLGYWHVDPRDNSLRSNRRTRELFGLPPDEENVELSLAIAAIHDQDRGRVVSTIQQTVTDPAHANYDIEYRVVHPGTKRVNHVRAIGKAYFDPGAGTAYRFSGTIQDITAKKEAEESLRASEQRFSAAIEAVQGILWTNSPDGRMLGAQPGWSKLTGQTQAEYEGFGWTAALHPDDVAPTVTAWNEAVAAKGRFVFEHRVRRADGQYRTFHVQAIPILNTDGSIYEWVGVHTDISEQRRTEEALRRSEEQLSLLADFMPQIVWATDAEGYHDFFNKRWYEFTGLSYEETKGEGWALVLHPDDAPRAWQVWQHSLVTGAYYEIEYRMRRADGQYRWLLARATPIRNENGTILRWFGTCTDIHDQKTSAETLERLVAERTRDLQRSNEDLQQFAHVASHDLKEPVRKIATFESRLSHDFGDQLPERARTYLEKIRLAARRMYTMIEGVLRYSSLNEGELRHFEPVDLGEVLAQIRSDLEVPIEQTGARIEAGPMPTVDGLPTLLYQLFYNIINNALKFADGDRAPLVRISSEEDGAGQVVIRVSDNGIGFEPEQAARIFKTFTRLNPKDRYEGTGLGLALCQKIVDRHGGTIRAEGKKDEGATFYITLPIRH